MTPVLTLKEVMLTSERFCRPLMTTGMKPINPATRATVSKIMELSVIRRIRGPLLGRNPHVTLFCLTPGRLHLTRRTWAEANQRTRRSAAISIHAVATRASLVDQLLRVAIMTDPAMSHREISLVVFLQLVQMRQIRHLQGKVIAVNGISDVERQRTPRFHLARHLELGRAIRSILQRTRRLRTPPMQLALPEDRTQRLEV